MNTPLYTNDVLRLAASLHGVRELDRVDGQAELRSPTCGSRISVSVQLDSERRVEALSQEVHACAFGQASAALLEAGAAGLTHADLTNVTVLLSRWLAQEQEDVNGWPGIDALAPARPRQARHGAILLPFRALMAAMEASR